MKRLLLLCILISFGLSANAQFINGIFGTVSDGNGNPIDNLPVNIDVICDDSLNSMYSTVYTNPNGFFGDTLYNCISGTVYVNYTCPDGFFGQAAQQFTPNNPVIDFILTCPTVPQDSCDLNFTSTLTGPAGFTFDFAASQTSGTAPYTYDWDFGDGSSDNSANPTHTFGQTGWNQVCVTSIDANGFTCTYCEWLWVPGGAGDTCLVDFNYNFDFLDPNQVNFTSFVNGATLPVTYAWDFGDNGTSTVANPSHTYNGPGQYTVCLTTTDADGTICSYCSVVWIQGQPDSCFVGLTYSIDPNDPLTVSFTTSVSGGTPPYNYFWNLGAGGTSSDANPTVTFPWGGPQVACVDVWTANQGSCQTCVQFSLQEPVDSCDNNLVILQLGLDNYPQETSWDITDENGNVVASSNGTYAGIPDGTVITETACLDDGCYVFNIYDTYGDGICCSWGQGYYSLTDSNGNPLAFGGDFDDSESTGFGFGVPVDSCLLPPPPIDTTPVCIDWTLFDWPPSCDITVDDPVCGCDGVTYSNSCIAEACFGVAIWTQGACDGDGGGNNGGGGVPCDTLNDLSIGFEYFGQMLQNGDWGYAFFGDASGGNPPFTYFWEISDSSFYNTEDIAHTFPATDTLQSYTVCLTVTDQSQCSVTVCETIVIDASFGGNVQGNVSEDGNLRPGDIVKSDGPGDPMPDVHIRLLDPAGNMIQETWTDADGNYEFFGLQLGDYYLHVDIPGIPHEPEHFKLSPLVMSLENFNFSVGDDGVSSTGIEDITFADRIAVYPNPATDYVMVELNLTNQTDLKVQLSNVLGQRVIEQHEVLFSGNQSFSVELNGLTPGIYLLSMQSGNEIFTQKILVQ
ncbi:MAG: PKD domain-containing protein [Bacteroidota bacterium]